MTAPSPLARRVGPMVVAASLVVLVGVVVVVGVLAVPRHPTLADADIEVPAVLLLDFDEDGCATLLDGTGAELASRCETELAWVEARPLDGTTVLVEEFVGREDPRPEPPESPEFRTFTLDLATGAREASDLEVRSPDLDRPDAGARVDGTRVLDDAGEVLVDLGGRPGDWLQSALVRDDGWIVVRDQFGRVVVVPPGGDPALWTERGRDRWVSLDTAVRWDE